jgi:urocanate hydratase
MLENNSILRSGEARRAHRLAAAGKAARNWECYEADVATPQRLEADERLRSRASPWASSTPMPTRRGC